MASKQRHGNVDQASDQWDQADDQADEDGDDVADDDESTTSPPIGYHLRRENRLRHQRAPTRRAALDDGEEDDVSGRGPRVRPAVRRRRPGEPEEFRCRHCRQFVVSVPSGGRHRNHCPYCLHSRHVDERMPGDRLSPCGGTMAPIGMFVRLGGEYALVHRCMDCGVVRHNRIAADDDFERVLGLPDLTDAPRGLESLAADDGD